jgi:hypothetical protein
MLPLKGDNVTKIEYLLSKCLSISAEDKKAIIEAVRLAEQHLIMNDLESEWTTEIHELTFLVGHIPENEIQKWPGDAYVVYLEKGSCDGFCKWMAQQSISSFPSDAAAVGAYNLYHQLKTEDDVNG